MNGRDYSNARMEAGEEHVIEIVSSFVGPDVGVECSCGWHATTLSNAAAEMVGEGHVRNVALPTRSVD